MFPALPTGMKWCVGAWPIASMISKAPVFCPSIRNGLIELTTVIGAWFGRSRTISSAWSKLPRIWRTLAPWMSAWASLPSAIVASARTCASASVVPFTSTSYALGSGRSKKAFMSAMSSLGFLTGARAGLDDASYAEAPTAVSSLCSPSDDSSPDADWERERSRDDAC